MHHSHRSAAAQTVCDNTGIRQTWQTTRTLARIQGILIFNLQTKENPFFYFQDQLSEDLLHTLKKSRPTAEASDVFDRALTDIEYQLMFHGHTLEDYPPMPVPANSANDEIIREIEQERFATFIKN